MKKHPNDPPACVDCRHFRNRNPANGMCYSDECSDFHTVRGREPVDAEKQRQSGYCGPSGKHFEPKPAPTWLDRNGPGVILTIAALGIVVYVTKGWLW